jgi:hypothetical protein
VSRLDVLIKKYEKAGSEDPAWDALEEIEKEKPAGKYHPPKKRKKDGFLKMERYDNTPMMELQKGLFQHGYIWRILDTMAPSTIKLYFTMVSMAILAPITGNKIAIKCYKTYNAEKKED